jgi:hypothetical protein
MLLSVHCHVWTPLHIDDFDTQSSVISPSPYAGSSTHLTVRLGHIVLTNSDGYCEQGGPGDEERNRNAASTCLLDGLREVIKRPCAHLRNGLYLVRYLAASWLSRRLAQAMAVTNSRIEKRYTYLKTGLSE